MKKTVFWPAVLLVFALAELSAQYNTVGDAEIEDREESFSERIEEGVRPNTPGRVTLYGELYARGWYGGQRGNEYVYGADMSGSDSFFGILWEFTNYTGMVFEIAAYPEANGMNAYFNKAYMYSDIAGEAGAKNFTARISLGRFGFDSAYYNPIDPMNTGDDMQHDSNLDTLNWKLEVGTKGDIYPLIFMIATDLDFGYRGQGASGLNKFNNRGFSGMAEIRSEGFDIADVVNMSWNVYYMGRFFPDVENTGATTPDKVLNKAQHTVGGTIGVTVAVAEGHSVKAGAGAELNMWSYGGTPTAMSNVIGRTFNAIDWTAGVGYTMADFFAVGLGFRQNGYSHAQWAQMNNRSPYSDMHAGVSFHYLGLKEIAKITLYAGFAYAFGSFYSSKEYDEAWNGDKDLYGVNNIDGYMASNPISVDVGIGYHPVSNASIFLGYNYGTWGLEAPDYASRDLNGSWGKFYLKGAYIW